MAFPETIFGKCPVCGNDGGEASASDLTGADATTDIDTDGNGVELIYFRGRLMCHICKNDELAEEETLRMNRRRRRSDEFRSRAGFKTTID